MIFKISYIICGIGWLSMPRMCIGLILMWYLNMYDIGMVLAIIGAVLDMVDGSSD
jgi:hypothetical protein